MCASVSSMYHILWKHNLKGEPCQYHNCLAELNHWSNYIELGFFRASLNPNYNHNSKVDYQRELKGHFRIIIPSKYQQQSKELLSSSAHCPWNSSVVIRCPHRVIRCPHRVPMIAKKKVTMMVMGTTFACVWVPCASYQVKRHFPYESTHWNVAICTVDIIKKG